VELEREREKEELRHALLFEVGWSNKIFKSDEREYLFC
jgi:hypothetical protein